MAKFKTLILVVFSCACIGTLSAQNLDMQTAAGSSTFDQPGKPTRGMTQARVEETYGPPSSARDPVGDPPITRWEYAGFVVFFEYDRVIHAVTKR